MIYPIVSPGESKKVNIGIENEQMAVWTVGNKWVVEPGAFTVHVGSGSNAILRQNFTVT
jgi:beta-glucosidase